MAYLPVMNISHQHAYVHAVPEVDLLQPHESFFVQCHLKLLVAQCLAKYDVPLLSLVTISAICAAMY
jgi:hypothetical protein